MNFDRGLHVINALALFAAALYFVFELKTTSLLLAQNLTSINDKLVAHQVISSHNGAREDLKTLAISVSKLH